MRWTELTEVIHKWCNIIINTAYLLARVVVGIRPTLVQSGLLLDML